ncbi:MAG: hypothetical protein AAF848_11890 [Pseudomonadota bacterium]
MRPTRSTLARLDRKVTPLLCAIVLAGCGLTPPDTGYEPSPLARQASFPVLLAQDAVDGLARDRTPTDAPDATPTATLDGRIAALRARAAALNAPVLDASEQTRLTDAPKD